MKIEKFAVIGHPIGHTMSPFIHKRLFELSGYEPEYSVLDIEDVKNSESQLRGLDGFNITIPHKRNIFAILDETDEKADVFGSVNTVRNDGGTLKGFTTDGIGCLKALMNHGADFGGKILLLGNGGAARAIAFEAVLANPLADITIVVREGSLPKGEELKSDLLKLAPKARLSLKTYDEEETSEEEYSLLINTTSLGMYPKTGVSPVTEKVVLRCENIFDAVYNPMDTELMRIAEKLHKNLIPGMEMLVFQAVAAHEHWYGAKFRQADILQLCSDANKEMERIFRK